MPSGPAIAATLVTRLAWDSTTPFGAAVEPEVNCNSAVELIDLHRRGERRARRSASMVSIEGG